MVEAVAWVCVGLAGGIALEAIRHIELLRNVGRAQKYADESLRLQTENRALIREVEHLRNRPEPETTPIREVAEVVVAPALGTTPAELVENMPWDMATVDVAEPTQTAAQTGTTEKMPWDL